MSSKMSPGRIEYVTRVTCGCGEQFECGVRISQRSTWKYALEHEGLPPSWTIRANDEPVCSDCQAHLKRGHSEFA